MRVGIFTAVSSLHLVNIYVNKFPYISVAAITTPHLLHKLHCIHFVQYSASALGSWPVKEGIYTAYMYVHTCRRKFEPA